MENQTIEMDLDKAQKTQRDYVCSRCWGHLHVIRLRKDVFTAKCPKGHDAGYVSKSYVERQRSNNHGEYVEAVVNLGPIFGEPKLSEEELLKQLGF